VSSVLPPVDSMGVFLATKDECRGPSAELLFVLPSAEFISHRLSPISQRTPPTQFPLSFPFLLPSSPLNARLIVFIALLLLPIARHFLQGGRQWLEGYFLSHRNSSPPRPLFRCCKRERRCPALLMAIARRSSCAIGKDADPRRRDRTAPFFLVV